MSMFSQWDDPSSYIEQDQKKPKSSKVDKFKKKQYQLTLVKKMQLFMVLIALKGYQNFGTRTTLKVVMDWLEKFQMVLLMIAI